MLRNIEQSAYTSAPQKKNKCGCYAAERLRVIRASCSKSEDSKAWFCTKCGDLTEWEHRHENGR